MITLIINSESTMLNKQEKTRLLERSKVYELLNFSQRLKLLWWAYFSYKKIDMFFDMLEKGKSVKYAFKDAEKTPN